jgi:hypothetical protein
LLLIRIQHRAGRDEPLERLLKDLPPAVEVVTDADEPPNPWRGYRKCLTDLPELGHVAVIQDDAVVCRNFAPALERIAGANPNDLVALFMSKQPKRSHNSASLRYGKSRYTDIHLQDICHVVAVLWPVAKARNFLEWVDGNPNRLRGRDFQSDDATVSRWMQLTKQRIRMTIPSIVQHPDDVPSVVNQHKVRAGADSGRVAGHWIGDADPLELDWTR